MFSSNVSLWYNFKATFLSPWPLNLHNFSDWAGLSMRLISLIVEKFPAPMINLLFAVSCASYLLVVPGTTRNFPPGEAGGENVFSSVADEAKAPWQSWHLLLLELEK